MRFLSILFLTLLLTVVALAGDWPQWRGPTGDGRSDEKAFPTTWSDTENVKWKVPLPGAGNSTPAVWKDKVILTASTGREHTTLHVLCYDRATGKQQWDTTFFASPAPAPFSQFPPERGHAAPSAATDGKVVVALFGSGDLVGLDLDGRLKWFRSLATEYGPFRNEYGVSSSPVLHDGTAFVQIDHDAESYLLAVDAATGKTRWRTKRAAEDGWATPLVVDVGGKPQVVCLGTKKAISYDAASGKPVWTLGGFERLCSVTPLVRDNVLYATSGPRGEVVAIDLSSASEDKTPKVLWRSKKIGPFIPSPVLVGKFLLVPDDTGFMTCLESTTGKELWKERMGGRARPSPVVCSDVVYLMGLDGTTVVFKAGTEFESVAKNKLGEEVAASPALAYGCLFIRGDKHLWCIGN
jgi:outer membrane protein assembly factor BamB